MVVAFKHMLHDNDLIDTFISLGTGGKFIHAQLIFNDGAVASSWMDTGVTFKTQEETIIYPWLYTFVPIYKDLDENKAKQYVIDRLDQPFDMVGATLSTWFPYKIHSRNKQHCSEVTFGALRAGGMFPKYAGLPAESVSPTKLYEMLKEQ